MTYQEPGESSDRTLWSIPFRATSKQARELYGALLYTAEWLEWSTLSDLLGTLRIDGTLPNRDDAERTARRHSGAYRRMSQLVIRKLAELEIDQ